MALLQHTFGILTSPSTEWESIRNDKRSFLQVFFTNVPLFGLIPVLAAFYGVTQVGWTIGNGDVTKLSIGSAMSLCGLTYAALLVGVYIFGEFIKWMSKTYGVKGDEDQIHYGGSALAVYVTTPIMIAGIAMAYPDIWMNAAALMLGGAYSVYLIYKGVPVLMNLDEDRAFMYSSSIITVGLVLLVSSMIGTVLLWGMGLGPVFID